MVIAKPRDTKDQHMNAHVITRGGTCMGDDATRKWMPRQPREETVIKKAMPLPKFDVHKQK